jgi:hypothetical protein
MGQTILCEVIAAWEETGEQPDFTQYGFASVLAALKEAQDRMFELGTSCNRLREKLDSQQSAQQGVQADGANGAVKNVGHCPECGQELRD